MKYRRTKLEPRSRSVIAAAGSSTDVPEAAAPAALRRLWLDISSEVVLGTYQVKTSIVNTARSRGRFIRENVTFKKKK
jgi:hypothetical protein